MIMMILFLSFYPFKFLRTYIIITRACDANQWSPEIGEFHNLAKDVLDGRGELVLDG